MRFIVFDLEATCDDGVRDFDNEIIEIGAVQFDQRSAPSHVGADRLSGGGYYPLQVLSGVPSGCGTNVSADGPV